jgi:succinyl-diaminopimelate desuccinylase
MKWPQLDHRLLVDVLRQLVRIPSRSTALGGEEGDVQRLVARYFHDAGGRVRTVSADQLPQFRTHPLCHGPDRHYADRPTVIAEFGPVSEPALLVVAHSDTVPLFAPDEWTVDPFGAIERDGAIYGLGVSDDKWGLATMVAIATALKGEALQKRIVFVSTIDEENGVGNGMLLLMLAGVTAEMGLYLDGQQMHVLRGGLGGSNLYLRPRRAFTTAERDAHVAALRVAAEKASRERARLFDQPGFEDNVIREISVQVFVRADDDGAIRLPFYQVPGESRADLQAQVERVAAEALGPRAMADYDISYREPWFEPSLLPDDHPMVRHVARAARDVLGREPTITTVSKQDNFVLTNHARIPTVSFGPTSRVAGRGAYHCPDECLLLGELRDGANIASRAVQNWLEDAKR